MTLLAEDLLLLCLDPDTGRALLDPVRLDRAVAGAVLAELALAGRVGPVDAAASDRELRVVVHDPRTTGDGRLDRALTRLVAARPPLRPARSVEPLVKGLRESLLAGLAEAGVIEPRRARTLGVFRTTAWPALRREPGDQLRDRLAGVLVRGEEPDERTRALVVVLLAVDVAARVLPGPADGAAVVTRARVVAAEPGGGTAGPWIGRVVRTAVDVVHAGLLSAPGRRERAPRGQG